MPESIVPHILGGTADSVPRHAWLRLAHGPRLASLMLSSKNLKVKKMTQRLKMVAADMLLEVPKQPAMLTVHQQARADLGPDLSMWIPLLL